MAPMAADSCFFVCSVVAPLLAHSPDWQPARHLAAQLLLLALRAGIVLGCLGMASAQPRHSCWDAAFGVFGDVCIHCGCNSCNVGSPLPHGTCLRTLLTHTNQAGVHSSMLWAANAQSVSLVGLFVVVSWSGRWLFPLAQYFICGVPHVPPVVSGRQPGVLQKSVYVRRTVVIQTSVATNV